jgi:hypothetical protein
MPGRQPTGRRRYETRAAGQPRAAVPGWTFVVTSYFLLLVRPHQDDTFPAMATRPWKVFPSLTDLITGVRSDLAFILIGQGTMSHEPTAGRR